MKHIAYGAVCGMIVIFVVVIIVTIQGRSLRMTETEHALSEAVDAALSNLMENSVYTIENNDLFTADLLQSVLAQMNSTSEVTVSVIEADTSHGILSVEVTETYQHPNGETGNVSAYRTVIFDKKVQEEKKDYTVSFYTKEHVLYKQYTVSEGAYCSYPTEPEVSGKRFLNWKYLSGETGEAQKISVVSKVNQSVKNVLAYNGNPLAVTKDISLIASFE